MFKIQQTRIDMMKLIGAVALLLVSSTNAANVFKPLACQDGLGPVAIDDKGNEFFYRKLIKRQFVENDIKGKIMRIIFELCPGETQITDEIDSGSGDYYRISPTNETIEDYKNQGFLFVGTYPNLSRAYSPVTILDKNYVELLIKVEEPGECGCKEKDSPFDCKYECCDGSCDTGITYMLATVDIGTIFLMTKKPEHGYWEDRDQGYYSHEISVVDDPTSDDYCGPYTLNFIGGGIALTEINVVSLSELLDKNVVEKVNYLWSNQYHNNLEWVYDLYPNNGGYDENDLATTFTRQQGKYGSRVSVGLVYTQEERDESPYPKGRINSDIIQDFFGVTKRSCGEQPKNILWLVVGSSGFKRAMYELLDCSENGLGFDLTPAPDDGYGINKVGDNSMYKYVARDEDPSDRKPSPIYKKYCYNQGLCEN